MNFQCQQVDNDIHITQVKQTKKSCFRIVPKPSENISGHESVCHTGSKEETELCQGINFTFT